MRIIWSFVLALGLVWLPLSGGEAPGYQEINATAPKGKTRAAEPELQVGGQLKFDIPQKGTSSGGDAAAALFIIIGAVAVVALAVYAGKYLYDVSTNDKEYEYWGDMSANFSFYNDAKTGIGGDMNGVKLAGGFKDGGARVGLAAEVGSYSFDIEGKNEDIYLNYTGSYAMVGPHIRFSSRPTKDYVYVELLGGKSSLEELKTIAVARMGYNAYLDDLMFGVNIGAIYAGLDEDEGIAKNIDNFNTSMGLEIGYRF